eukprot:TRINITY_DN77420_c0_g1_i1.p1 TRINITY_DN77420_c0_g1~~TRINITY_DN77420_c0_g1_i1.p1  ORF type:complete len:122 (-),score=0.06 TRINITY_DN77420_c0_g1_i1:53-418(-)
MSKAASDGHGPSPAAQPHAHPCNHKIAVAVTRLFTSIPSDEKKSRSRSRTGNQPRPPCNVIAQPMVTSEGISGFLCSFTKRITPRTPGSERNQVAARRGPTLSPLLALTPCRVQLAKGCEI